MKWRRSYYGSFYGVGLGIRFKEENRPHTPGRPRAENPSTSRNAGDRATDTGRDQSDWEAKLMEQLGNVLCHEALTEFRELDHRIAGRSETLRNAACRAEVNRAPQQPQDPPELLEVELDNLPASEATEGTSRTTGLAEAARKQGERDSHEVTRFEMALDNDPDVARIVGDALKVAIRLLEVRSVRHAHSRVAEELSIQAEASGTEALSNAILGVRQRFIRALRALEAGLARPWRDCAPLLRPSAWDWHS